MSDEAFLFLGFAVADTAILLLFFWVILRRMESEYGMMSRNASYQQRGLQEDLAKAKLEAEKNHIRWLAEAKEAADKAYAPQEKTRRHRIRCGIG